ncbi:hypothetical protein ABIB40_001871 [Pedobacter sp. UYP30]|uniref:IS1096 element passenger TnpR family protein n=1 Tax=Pedobacter sp. UYP30 TaxID=1756400 RepID=UPI00339485DA
MAIYKFKITFEDFDDVIQEIDIKSNQTFLDLHRAIHKTTGYDVEKASSFYVSTDNWLKGDEIAYLPNDRKKDRVVLMENSKLSGFIEDPHQKFYYIYNFERSYEFHVELIKIILESNPNIQYPYLAKSVGIAPKMMVQNSSAEADSTGETSSEFDFLNAMDFVPEDADEIESMGGLGINEEEKEGADEEENEDEFGGDDEAYGEEEEKDY